MNVAPQTVFRRWLQSAAGRMSAASAGPGAAPVGTGRLKNRTLSLAFAVLAVLYTLWPVDLIPDLIPVLGWLDDGLLLLWAVREGWQALRGRAAAN